ncbi:hypothetical protein LUZ61_019913 [Rhynchospora tenuis]|uniref:Adenylosuccinate lyase n=1 Tax=Rhynchospora tenuis TaxID=198213 RepID=A0AAD5ZCC3_9POAL|nr:hypothetical protein LUZ61_019913 [Rhynchospora tenuis]
MEATAFGSVRGGYERRFSGLRPSTTSYSFLRRRQCGAVLNSTSSTVPAKGLTANSQSQMEPVNADLESFSLMMLSPLDGRYQPKVKEMQPFFSEYGLIFYRVLVEVKWLLKLSEIPEVKEVPTFTQETRAFLENIIQEFSLSDAREVKNIEKVTNHDVKAVEYFLKQKCKSHPEISKVLEFFHFACTSEDINNLAYGLMLKDTMNTVMFPFMADLCKAFCALAKDNAHVSMLSRTHGQSASPTTLGKEMAIFAYRLGYRAQRMSEVRIFGKFAGAVGNYNAHKIAYPEIDWPRIAQEFVTSLGLQFNPYVTQIEPHDYMVELFDNIAMFNNVLADFDDDVWNYISFGYFKQLTKEGEIGSSTMPHKVNPIDFENSRGNLYMANQILSGLSMKLPISRMQRDLVDSTLLRNVGVGLAHSLLAYKSALQGIKKLQVNELRLTEDLEKNWEVLAEAIQTVMRRYDVPEPYEKLKELTRGRAVNKENISSFIQNLDLPEEPKSNLLNLTPNLYIGEAENLARSIDEVLRPLSGLKIN